MEIDKARRLAEEIRALTNRIELVRQSAKNLVPWRDGMPKPPYKSGSALERIIYKMLELAEERDEKQKELEAAKVELIEGICAVAMSEPERRVLMLRYVNCMRFRDICFELKYSDARVYQLHRAGLKKLQLHYSRQMS